MAVILQKSQGNGIGDVKIIKVDGKRHKGEEVMVRHGIVPPEWKTWNHEEFSREWSKTFLTNKRGKNLNKENDHKYLSWKCII